ncbi:hypothetical protein SAMN05444483_101499 [Salegentibacter echinorum]|uniref:Uncharacterized protein n=1 Tax=Salegentibacter echinorum TaxID=1073325 RepID=A0A1M5CFI8_SALEC|nr:hypothetical protein SAMN05444483_101499 [Salegentibacter echinorum]
MFSSNYSFKGSLFKVVKTAELTDISIANYQNNLFFWEKRTYSDMFVT